MSLTHGMLMGMDMKSIRTHRITKNESTILATQNWFDVVINAIAIIVKVSSLGLENGFGGISMKYGLSW